MLRLITISYQSISKLCEITQMFNTCKERPANIMLAGFLMLKVIIYGCGFQYALKDT